MEDTTLENQDNLINENDLLILLHKEAHFGGSFDLMEEYYVNERKGTHQEIDLKRIRTLHDLEKKSGQNLAVVYFSESDVENIKKIREHYSKLKDFYEDEKLSSSKEKLIADLILSENEEPLEEIQAIVSKGPDILPALVDLLQSDEYHDPLFPGYGLAPSYALRCIGLIGNEKAIMPLFEAIGREDVEAEEEALTALKKIGEPALHFLIKVAKSKPFTFDNERAAIALLAFKETEEAARTSLDLLKVPELRKKTPYSSYLALVCEGLTKGEEREEFVKLANDPQVPRILKDDIEMISKFWKKSK